MKMKWQEIMKWIIIGFVGLFLVPSLWAGLVSGLGDRENFLPAYILALVIEFFMAVGFIFYARRKKLKNPQ